jgi:Ca2+-binding EF-hand superfamily protein
MSVMNDKNSEKSSKNVENKSENVVNVNEEYQATKEECINFLQSILDKISNRFTKKYLNPTENNNEPKFFFIPVEFFERKNKLPIPEFKVEFLFKVGKSLKKSELSFQIENESVYYPLFNSLNLSYFESLIDRVLLDKFKLSKALHLQTNFELSRILNLNGETKKLFTIEEDEQIFTNNKSDYYKYDGVDLNFNVPNVEEIDKLIKIMWKTLVDTELREKTDQKSKKKKEEEKNQEEIEKKEVELFMNYDKFKLLFEYGNLDMSEENIQKLWKYTNKKKTENINYEDFANFAIFLIHCLSAWNIALYKHKNNNCFEKKIQNCVEIMNLHFKEYDSENNEEISFENLKKCLLKENELFTRKEIEIILQQINPEKNFQYWKFDRILRILYYKNFNYQKLMNEDKIYKYLINIFQKQDPFKTGKIHYKKMKQAFLTENKIKFQKTEILLILNQFEINKNPEIEYYPASLILRNIIDYLLSSEIGMQKIDISQPNFMKYSHYEDEYDEYCRDIKGIFIKYDQDFDHLLNKEEFSKFYKWLTPYVNEKDIEDKLKDMDVDKDGKLNYQEFKNGFKELMERTRIKNVICRIKNVKNEEKKEEEKKEEEEKNEENNENEEKKDENEIQAEN